MDNRYFRVMKDNTKKITNNLHQFISEIKNINKENYKDLFKKYSIQIIGLVIVFTVIIFTVFFATVSSRDEVLKNLEKSLNKGNASAINGEITLAGEDLAKTDIEPFIQYYVVNKDKITPLINALKTNGVAGVVEVKSKKKFFWQDYYIDLTPLSLKIETNYSESTFYINEKEIASNGMVVSTVPGIYNIVGELQSNYGKLHTEKEVTLMQNDKVKMNFNAIDLEISSPYKDAKVYINGADTSKTVENIGKIGPVPTDGSVTIELEKEFPWGTKKSDKVIVKDIPNLTINIDMVNDALIEEIKDNIEVFYTSVFEALNKGDKTLIKASTDEVKTKIYQELEKKGFLLRNNYEISDLQVNIENSEFSYNNETYTAKIVVKVNYEIYKKLLPFSKAKREDMFLTNMQYKGGEWMVQDIQKFSTEIVENQ